jgi:DNA polymerase-3 subunit epsilon
LDISFGTTKALEDAKAAGNVLIAACAESGIGVEEWLSILGQTKFKAPRSATDTSNGVVVFTGSLRRKRRDAAEMAINAGFTVEDNVTRRTTFLVLDTQALTRLAGYEKSIKHRKAEDLIARGQAIRILTEENFEEVIGSRAP